MDCVIQAFPDEYHLQTLEFLLDATTQLDSKVDIKNIFIGLMEKLSKFVSQSEGQTTNDKDIFKLFKKYTDKIIEEQGKTIDVARLLELEVAFLNFSIQSNPNNLDQVNSILESCVAILKSTTITNSDQQAMKLLVKLLSIPLQSLSIQVLNMNHYPELMKYMKFSNRRQVALQIVKAVIKENRQISNLTTC